MRSSLNGVPTPVRVLYYLFYLGAWSAVAHIAIGLFFQARLNFDLNVLGFWIAPGLVKGDRRWWTWALAFTWFGVVGVPVIAYLLLSGMGAQLVFRLFDYAVAPLTIDQFLLLASAVELLWLWSLWALYRHSPFKEQRLTQLPNP